MVKVIGHASCDEAAVEHDPWVPMKATWLPRPSADLIYLRVSGTAGGEIELKLDLHTGMLVSFIVLISPPSTQEFPDISGTGDIPSCSAPLIDRSYWVSESTAASSNLRHGSVADAEENLGMWTDQNSLRLFFTDHRSSSVLRCGPVWVGISNDGELAEIGAELNS
ncbi:hypothetical protein JK358_33400 [Nocardia sp. 2]|uniref:Uncharacterized protein n=1 Tax=Nocardia acididurans TaxID=2802282 RepID=A0ABS1MJA4_9NOCA|nr:hypothetical protein [Nocardia acididurans]MBL1079313.1 hypothetical protein [Nocardia acididurans]